jgi:CubicO group peptidase (beta-lactamase class C family)
MEARLRSLRIPGLSLAVVRDGEIVKASGYGLADLQMGVAATPQTVYEIGSMTKQFTAAAVMMLVEDGRLRLDDRVSKFFRAAPRTWRNITVRHLLTHSSGIQNHVAVAGYMGIFRTNLFFETTPAPDALLKRFFKLPLEFQPGETWAYDNTGYYLLGLIVEQASGKPFWTFLHERIFTPLGMTSTRNTDVRPLVRHRAAGYEWVGDGFENRPVLLPPIAFSAGSLLSTVEDLARWDAALSTDRLLKASSLEQMWTATRAREGRLASVDYGFGWFVGTYEGRRFVQHGGGTPGFSSVIYRFLDDKLTVIVLSNRSDRVLDHLALDIAGFYVDSLKRAERAVDPDPGLTDRLTTITAGLLKGQHDPAAFTNPMRTFLRTATGRGLWEWFASHGELKSMTFSSVEDLGDSRLVRYAVLLNDNRYWFSFRMTPDGERVAQINWW